MSKSNECETIFKGGDYDGKATLEMLLGECRRVA